VLRDARSLPSYRARDCTPLPFFPHHVHELTVSRASEGYPFAAIFLAAAIIALISCACFFRRALSAAVRTAISSGTSARFEPLSTVAS
jgi:hypothetical protein